MIHVTRRGAGLERFAATTDVHAHDRAIPFDMGRRIARVARETRGFAGPLDARRGQVTRRTLRERRVKAMRPGVDEVRADKDRTLELEAEGHVASRARSPVVIRVEDGAQG